MRWASTPWCNAQDVPTFTPSRSPTVPVGLFFLSCLLLTNHWCKSVRSVSVLRRFLTALFKSLYINALNVSFWRHVLCLLSPDLYNNHNIMICIEIIRCHQYRRFHGKRVYFCLPEHHISISTKETKISCGTAAGRKTGQEKTETAETKKPRCKRGFLWIWSAR